jgi:hypothetical protein
MCYYYSRYSKSGFISVIAQEEEEKLSESDKLSPKEDDEGLLS